MTNRPNLVLVGFMGAGKSSVGQKAASRLDLTFVDSDLVIEAKAGKSIPQIFSDDGEQAFRSLERNVLSALSEERGLVIATGGGAFVDDSVRNLLKACGLTVYLKASFSDLWERIGHVKGRPLLEGDDGKQRAAGLFQAREPIYEKAHVIVDCARPFNDVVGEVVEVYREYAGSNKN